MEISIPNVRVIFIYIALAFICLFLTPRISEAQGENLLFSVDPEIYEVIQQLGDEPASTLPVPIPFAVSVGDFSNSWGDARSGGRAHEGTDILAPAGEIIVSPTEAVVTKIGYNELGGNFVITANPGDEQFYYAHLESVAPGLDKGDVLDAGDIIGYVGDTGNAKGTPHLHFEIFSDGLSINPFFRLSEEFSLDKKTEILVDVLDTSIIVKDAENSGVRFLQQFLIEKNSGPKTRELAKHGATGYFGGVTEQALIEYQKSQGIEPAVGFFGTITKNSILTQLNPSVALTNQLAHAEAVYEVEEVVTDVSGVGEGVGADISGGAEILSVEKDLEIEDESADVKILQEFLVAQNSGPHAGALRKNGTTKYFGPLTEDALIEYQETVGISPAKGYFGPMTRAKIRNSVEG